MRYFCRAGLALILIASLHPASAPAKTGRVERLLNRMEGVNPGLVTYSAQIHSLVSVRGLLFLRPDLRGTYYHKRPSLNKIVFTDGLPAIASAFSKVYPQVPSPSQWTHLYHITFVGEDGRVATMRLVPIVHSRIDHIDVAISEADATVRRMRWTYNDGGFAQLNQSFATIAGHIVVVRQSGELSVPLWSGTVETTLSHYVWNPRLPDKFFNATPG